MIFHLSPGISCLNRSVMDCARINLTELTILSTSSIWQAPAVPLHRANCAYTLISFFTLLLIFLLENPLFCSQAKQYVDCTLSLTVINITEILLYIYFFLLGMSIYAVVVMSILGTICLYALDGYTFINIRYAIIAFAIVVSTLATVLFLFLPKVTDTHFPQ